MSNNSIKILLIEDNPGDTRLIREMLKEFGSGQYNLDCADRLSTGLEHLAKQNPAIVLLDLGLPDSQGLDTLARVSAQAPTTPIVVLTGLDDEATALEAVRRGTEDYLVKGQISGRVLWRVIRYAIERKRAEQALRKSEERYRTILDGMDDGYYEVDLAGNYTMVNDAECRHLGYTKEELIGTNYRVTIAKEDVETVFKAFNQVYRTGQPFRNLPCTVISKDGSEWVAELSSFPLLNEKGEIIGFRGIDRDVTERKRAEEAIRRAEANYRSSLDDSPLGTRILTTKGETVYANRAILDIYGYDSLDELKATPRIKCYAPESYAQHQIRKEKRRRGEYVPSEYEISIVRKTGEVRHLQVLRKEVQWNGEKQFQVIYQDTTERKRAEMNIEHLNSVLRALRNVNQLITKENDRAKLLKGACDNMTKTRGYRSAWTALFDDAGKVQFTTESGLGKAFLPMLKRLKRGELTECGRHVLKQPGLFMKDPSSACADCPLATTRGEKVAMVARLEYGSKTYGMLAVSLPANLTPDMEEQSLFQELVDDIAFGLYKIEMEEQRKQAEEDLKLRAQLLNSVTDSIFVADLDSNIIYVNEAAHNSLGYTREELMKIKLLQLNTPESDKLRAPVLKDLIEKGSITFETAQRRKDGSIIPLEVHSRIVEADNKKLTLNVARDITERKQAEGALKESEEKYRSVVERANDGICIIQDGMIKYLNPRLAKMWGSTAEELSETPFTKYLHPDDVLEIADRYKRRMAGEDVTPTYEIAFMLGDGRKLYGEVNAAVITYKGKPANLVVLRDITERKQAEETLRQSEEKYRTILAEIADSYFEVDLAGNLTFFNDSTCRNLAYSREELLGLNYRSFTAEEDIEHVYQVFNEVYRTGEPNKGFPWKIDRKDRGTGFVDASASVLRDHEGKIIGFRGVGRDVTQRKQAEEALRESEVQYRLLADHMVDTVWLMDMNLRTTYISPSVTRLRGFTLQEIEEMPLERHLTPESLRVATEVFLEEMAKVEADTNYNFLRILELEFYRKDGTSFWSENTFSIIRDENGRPVSILGEGRDITERKQAEEALRGSEQRLKEAQALGKIGSWEFDLATQKIEWSDEVYVLYERDKALGPPSPEEEAGYYPPEEAKRLREFARLATETGEQFDYGLMAKLPSGRIAFFDATMRPIKDKEGRVIKLFGTAQDVTEREKADEAIEKQREEYRTIFDSVRPMIAYLNKGGTIMRINRAGASVFGLEPKEVIGKTMYDLFPPDEAATFTRQNMKVISSGKPSLGVAMQYTRPSGEKLWAQVDTIPYSDEHGDIIGVIQFNQDITRRKLAEENLERSYEALHKTLLDTIAAMAAIVEMKDPYTAGHQVRVAQVAVAIAEEMNLPDEQISSVRAASTIHDIGKIYVPSEILNKPGKLSEIEFGMIKAHVQGSYDILKNIDFPWPIAQITLQHHERLDGSGYPKGLRGEEMLLEAKILAVSDVVEAMASHRPYRPALGIDKALEEISLNRDILYDANVADTCLRLFNEKGFKFE